MTQAELAEELTRVTGHPWKEEMVTALENGRRKINDDLIRALVRATGFSAEWFLYGPQDLLTDEAKGVYLSSPAPIQERLFDDDVMVSETARAA